VEEISSTFHEIDEIVAVVFTSVIRQPPWRGSPQLSVTHHISHIGPYFPVTRLTVYSTLYI
jgi:hypothetical protein